MAPAEVPVSLLGALPGHIAAAAVTSERRDLRSAAPPMSRFQFGFPDLCDCVSGPCLERRVLECRLDLFAPLRVARLPSLEAFDATEIELAENVVVQHF